MGAMSVEPLRHRFSVDDYYKMAEAGLFAPGQRLELLDGEIIEMNPIGISHASIVDRLTRLFVRGLGDEVWVRVQNPVRLSDLTEPEPDITLLRPRADSYSTGHPRPEDVVLVVEVADTTLRWDRSVKRPLYAAAGVPEVWIVDVGGGVVEVATGPGPEDYAAVRQATQGEQLTPVMLPDHAFAVADIVPPSTY